MEKLRKQLEQSIEKTSSNIADMMYRLNENYCLHHSMVASQLYKEHVKLNAYKLWLDYDWDDLRWAIICDIRWLNHAQNVIGTTTNPISNLEASWNYQARLELHKELMAIFKAYGKEVDNG